MGGGASACSSRREVALTGRHGSPTAAAVRVRSKTPPGGVLGAMWVSQARPRRVMLAMRRGGGGGGKGGGKGWAGRAGSGSSTGRRAKWDVDGGEGRKGRAAGGGRAHDTGSSSVPQTVCRGGGEGWMHTYQGDLSCAPAPPLRSHLSLATRLQLSAAPPPTPSRAAISHGLCSFSHEASWPWPLGRPGRFRRRG